MISHVGQVVNLRPIVNRPPDPVCAQQPKVNGIVGAMAIPRIAKGVDSVMHTLRLIPLLASASLALAQQYTISTVAGGAPPSTPVSATSASIGQPRHVAVDSAGNVYFSSSHSVFKMTASGVLTLVAGN